MKRPGRKFVFRCVRRAVCIYPIAIHVLIIANYVSCFLGVDYTRWLYPVFGHSFIFDLLLLLLSVLFDYCLWHRMLVYSLLFNIVVEWIIVNFVIEIHINNVMVTSALISSVFVVGSVVSVVTENRKRKTK